MITALKAFVESHPFWDNKLLWASRKGLLSREELAYFFGQYSHYSLNFTRGISLCMANLKNDLWRAHLSANLWDEGGGADPEERHSEIFHRFLLYLGVDREALHLAPATRLFVMEWLEACGQRDTLAAVAHLSFGTEGIVSRMYQYLVAGLSKAGVPDSELRFFHLHMACDDAHAETLEAMVSELLINTRSFEAAREAVDRALNSRMAFFDGMYERLRWMRIEDKMNAIQDKASLVGPKPLPKRLLFKGEQSGIVAYANQNTRLGIDFTVEHLSFSSEVLDTRIVRIAVGATNERHRHAHETLYHVISGVGTVAVNDTVMEVRAGDVAFIPRWAFHQAVNKGADPFVILTVTDYCLTGKVFFGNYLKTARLDQSLSEVATGKLNRGISHDAPLLNKSLESIIERRPAFAGEFYQRLFTQHPESRALFGRHSAERQERMLTDALTALIDHIEDAPWVMQTLRTLGARHHSYGVTEEMYAWVGDALMDTFADITGEGWSDALHSAWRGLYDEVASIMIEATLEQASAASSQAQA